MTILVVSNWHERPDLLLDQVENYNIAFDGDVLHYVNINAGCAASFEESRSQAGIDLAGIGNLHFLNPAIPTQWGKVAHAYFQAVLAAMADGRRFDYVYFHTSSDLLIKPGIARHIRDHDLGLGKPWKTPATFETRDGQEFIDAETTPEFYDAIRADPLLAPMLRAMRMDSLHKSRAEGCFFRADLFFELVYPLLAHRSLADMRDMAAIYPIEEYAFSICVEFLCGKRTLRRAKHVIATSETEEQIATEEEMQQVLADPQLFGIKRFLPSLDDPLRVRARQLVAQGRT
ncbi:hypothetical protein [Sabulicella glaciei]|uniref:Uncharacterized protein n=1 Tax=Sabulicella glaciei TaxID=2984948 RepID=A0ABT3NVL5_9PROT|nr:hypothetical protein [Roseococcus sp. MDT2-1-1]MCW8086203.1 hypothetical protein [Roseococcus sp. MDT2-1-1]